MSKLELHKAGIEFQLADDAWQAALVDVFGNAATYKRYKPAGHGATGSALRAAYDVREKARAIYAELAFNDHWQNRADERRDDLDV